MATSGSTDHATSRANLIKDALIECHVIAHDESPTTDMTTHASRVLNDMVKHWQVMGHNLFRRSRDTITLTASKGVDTDPYTFGGSGSPTKSYRPLRIESMRFKSSDGIERPMIQISRDEYDNLPEKDSTGEATLYHYDPQTPQAKLYIWPVLSSSGSGTLVYTYQRTIEDFDADANEPDYPQEWFEVLKYGLAARLAPVYYPEDMNMQGRLAGIAAQKLQEVSSFDKEPVSSFFMVEYDGRW